MVAWHELVFYSRTFENFYYGIHVSDCLNLHLNEYNKIKNSIVCCKCVKLRWVLISQSKPKILVAIFDGTRLLVDLTFMCYSSWCL